MDSNSHPLPWHDSLANTSALAVIDRAIRRNRLSHSLLLTGDDPATLEHVALGIADRILNVKESSARFHPDQHPDCFQTRPAGKMRIIGAEATRALISRTQVSASVSPHKVAILHEADRMNPAASNIFLKTLEEPPANTTLLLLTRRPYALLPTIRSRVLHFRFSQSAERVKAEGWDAWIKDYHAWMGSLSVVQASDKKSAADVIFSLYGLVARFAAILESAASEEWGRMKEKLPADMDDDEREAFEAGISIGLRTRLFAEIARSTRDFAVSQLETGDERVRRAIVAAIDRLEHVTGLLRVNLNDSAALEQFLLGSLRIWSRRST